MKENEPKKNFFNYTFNNFNIKREKIDIPSKIEKINIKEYNDMKLIATCFLPINLKNNNDLLINYNINKAFSNKNNIKSTSTRQNKVKKKLFSDLKRSKKNLDKTMIISLNKKNITNDKEINDESYHKLNKETAYKTLSEEKSEKVLRFKKEKIKNTRNKTKSFSNLCKNIKPFTSLIANNNKNNQSNKKNNEIKNFKNINNESKTLINKYLRTAENFTNLPNVKSRRLYNDGINNYLYKTKTNNFYSTLPSKSFTIKHRNRKMINNIKLKFFNNGNNDSLNENKKKMKNLYKRNKKPKINLSYWELRKIEDSLNEEYNNNFMDITNNNKIIRKIKEKCKYLLKELDKKNNFEIYEIIREVNEQLLGLGFKDFYRYLLTILKNYDKKIADYGFDIIEEKKECPEELKLKNVEKRHQKFMRLLEKQFVSGVNANKLLDDLIKNSKSKMGFNNNEYYDKINFNSSHRNINRNGTIDNNLNNYRTKFYKIFKK